MKDKKKLKKIPTFKTDQEAEKFVADADLTDYDISRFKPMKFEFKKKTEQINMRVPKDLLAGIKAIAKEKGIPYTRFIREILERYIEKSQPST